MQPLDQALPKVAALLALAGCSGCAAAGTLDPQTRARAFIAQL